MAIFRIICFLTPQHPAPGLNSGLGVGVAAVV